MWSPYETHTCPTCSPHIYHLLPICMHICNISYLSIYQSTSILLVAAWMYISDVQMLEKEPIPMFHHVKNRYRCSEKKADTTDTDTIRKSLLNIYTPHAAVVVGHSSVVPVRWSQFCGPNSSCGPNSVVPIL